jgi:predicted metal-dependent hydrolase
MDIQYTLIRAKRKTLSMKVQPDGSLLVKAPPRATNTDIERFIKNNEKWISVHVENRKELFAKKNSFTLEPNDNLRLCGKLYPLKERAGGHAGFDEGVCFYVPQSMSDADIKRAVIVVYKALAGKILNAKVYKYAATMDVRFTGIKINSAKSRWGSCSALNKLHFCWRLVMADDDIVDYVVVHELAHCMFFNHSKKFWDFVGKVLPDYADRRRRLRDFEKVLAREDWDN